MDKEIKNILDNILSKLENLQQGQKIITAKQEEIYNVVKAIEHANEVHKAEIDNLNLKNAKLEGTFNKISHVINEEIA